ncbi:MULTISPECIES: DMT family transporter [Tenebrionibacter/Tenebrionicola group]|jgi:transporter family-2 protein|uniref:DMT family transporter n=2 Tax=Tenebrionibacter/Tenebrionicola group TaxID=2969848 RepID=A0A8K0V257_9ENTR|nr:MULTISPECIES: DMT family transporter [Tenebrionibacter/Tenebrionicola group]MBK4715613.1 DMT family transporter [Tenebrionibacter intestinalis]MBV4412919.1 DMT family transporter [Tenebrionicola larvae]MBV5094603.1 DMT family transporter [Tenebrionicola larvae]
MLIYIAIALLNGVCISLSRSVNGRLGMARSAFYASLWNHIVGFLFLTVVIFAMNDGFSGFHFNAPWYAYVGGALGALFVTINSYILPRTGSTQAAMLIISGQMISGVAIDQLLHSTGSLWMKFAGVTLIIAGIWVSKLSALRKARATIQPNPAPLAVKKI